MENEQRRSPRIMFSIPVSVKGTDEKGLPFEAKGRTITLNRQGARIQISHPLKPGQTLHVVNQANSEEAEFRVVGPLAPPRDQMGEWGIECLHGDKNVWDIQFPPAPVEDDSPARILLSCRHCHHLSLQALSLMDVEVLDTAGLLTRPCAQCGETTQWGYERRTFEEETQTFEAAKEPSDATSALTVERRKSPRKAAQIPLRVRDYFGETELTQTENVSQDGFCFASRRRYLLGQGIVVICPYDPTLEKSEVRARIVRSELGSEHERYVYGVRFELASH
jgi:hypothetical protein